MQQRRFVLSTISRVPIHAYGASGSALGGEEAPMMTLADLAVRRFEFRLDSRRIPHAGHVTLVGAFNRWDSAVHELVLDRDGWWTTAVTLGPGHLYLVDGHSVD
jgi:1,4-alpha-glucan branching enzyme